MNLILFFYFLAHLANGWVMMRPISSHFGYSLAPLLEWSQSEGRAKAERRQSGGRVETERLLLYYTKKNQKLGCHF